MNSKFYFPIFIMLLVSSCTTDKYNGLRKLSAEESYKALIDSINNPDDSSNVAELPIYVSVDGDTIPEDSLQKLNRDSVGFDHYVDSENQLKLVVVRPINEEDIKAYKMWDSLLTYNRPFLLKFINTITDDSITKQGILRAYEDKMPLQTYFVNCDSTYDYLISAFHKDQEVRALKQSHLYQEIDRSNQELVLSIIQCCGSDEIKNQGADAVNATFMIIQHSTHELQKKYYPMFEQWALEGYLKPGTLALMIDRIRTGDNKKQIFGSQIRYHESGKAEVSPIEDPKRVNILRDSVGLEPLEDYLSRFGIDYSYETSQ